MVGEACGSETFHYTQSFTFTIPEPDLTFHFKNQYCDWLSNNECHPTFSADINGAIDFNVGVYNDGGPIWNIGELFFKLIGKYTPDLQHQKDIASQSFLTSVPIENGYIPGYSSVSCTWTLTRDGQRKYFIPTFIEADCNYSVTETAEWNNIVDNLDYDCKYVLVWQDLPSANNYPWPFNFEDNEFDKGVITSVLNEPRNVGTNWGRFHSGVDIGKPLKGGENVISCSSGPIKSTNPSIEENGSTDVGNFRYVHVDAPKDVFNLNYFNHERAWVNTQNIVGKMPIDHVHLMEGLNDNRINPLRQGGLSPSVENTGFVKYYEAYVKGDWGENLFLTVQDRYVPLVSEQIDPGSYTFYLSLMDEGMFGGAMGVYSISSELYLVDLYGDPLNALGAWSINMDTWFPNTAGATSEVFPYFYDPTNCVTNWKKPYVLTNAHQGATYSTAVELYMSGFYMMVVDIVAESRDIDNKRAYISFLVE